MLTYKLLELQCQKLMSGKKFQTKVDFFNKNVVTFKIKTSFDEEDGLR